MFSDVVRAGGLSHLLSGQAGWVITFSSGPNYFRRKDDFIVNPLNCSLSSLQAHAS